MSASQGISRPLLQGRSPSLAFSETQTSGLSLIFSGFNPSDPFPASPLGPTSIPSGADLSKPRDLQM